MKKIGKLAINAEKVLKNEELVYLRGGYYGGYDPYACGEGLTCYCVATYNDYQGTNYIEGYVCNQTSSEDCRKVFAELHPAASSTGCSGF